MDNDIYREAAAPGAGRLHRRSRTNPANRPPDDAPLERVGSVDSPIDTPAMGGESGRLAVGLGNRDERRESSAYPDSSFETLTADQAQVVPRPGRRATRRIRKGRIAEAKHRVAVQAGLGKGQVKQARRRVKRRHYLADVLPSGDWTRRERRDHIASARKKARAELAEVRASAEAALAEARANLRSVRQSSGRSGIGRHLADARVRSIRLGLIASWAALGTMTWVAWDTGSLERSEYWMPLVAGAAGLMVFSLTPWKRLGWRPVSSVLVFLWLTMLMAIMMSAAPYHQSTLSIFIASLWIVVYAAALLPLLGYAVSAAMVIGAFGVSIALGPAPVPHVELALLVAGLAMTALIGGFTVHELRSQAMLTAGRLTELDTQRDALFQREREILQLYEVSRTIGAGEDISEVLPELVARTAGYIGAKVGLVILHRPEDEQLIALSPLWVAGQALEAEGYRFDVDGESTAAIVFESGAAHLRNALSDIDISRDKLLADLGVERVAAVPLRVEGHTIGVLLVADKATDFTGDDIAALELLSTPAGLVLNHLARYQQAQETGRRMSEVAQLKSDFVSVVSHELRTPLTSVIGSLSTLARPELAPDNPVALSLLDSASGQAKRLKTLIEDLLTVSKVDNDALPIRLSIGNLGEALTRIVNLMGPWTEHVTLELSPNLPNVAFDPDHFERVITNLLDNASKYAGGSPIEMTARAVDGEVWISVIDHGEGIPYEYEETIFERFTQIERPDTRFQGGTGLGLNIVKELTEAMKGRVWLETTPGSGATFVLAFPRARADATPTVEVGSGMLLVDPSRDRVEAPVDMDDLSGGSTGPVAE